MENSSSNAEMFNQMAGMFKNLKRWGSAILHDNAVSTASETLLILLLVSVLLAWKQMKMRICGQIYISGFKLNHTDTRKKIGYYSYLFIPQIIRPKIANFLPSIEIINGRHVFTN